LQLSIFLSMLLTAASDYLFNQLLHQMDELIFIVNKSL